MPQVKMPDGTIVDMPEKLSPQEAIAFQKLMSRPAPAPAKAEAAWYQPAVDVAKNIGTGLYKGFAGLPAAAADVFGSQPDFADAITARIAGKSRPLSQNTSVVSEALEKAPGYTPKTAGERYVQAGAKGIGSALSLPMGGPANLAVTGAASGLGSEAAANAFGDTPVSRILGGLAGGVGGGLLMSAKTNAPTMAREALEGVSEADLTTALRNMEQMKAAGMPGNLAQAMERQSNVDKLVEALAGNRFGHRVQAQLRAQPQQARMGLEEQMALMPGTIRTPQTVANNAQDVATAVIDESRKARTAAWEAKKAATEKATFGTAKNVRILPEVIDDIGLRLEALAAQRPNTEVAARLTDLRSRLFDADGVPLTNPQQLNEVLKEAATRLKSPDLTTKGIDAGQAKFLQRTIEEIRQDVGPGLAPVRAANQAYVEATRAVNELKKSIVGRVAGRKGELADVEAVRSKVSSLFDQGSVPGAAASDILELEKQFRPIKAGQFGAEIDGAAAYQDAVKSWMGERISEAVRPVGGRLNEDLPKRLTEAFAKDEVRSQGFRDMLVGMARSQGMKDTALYPGMEKFLKLVGMASRRPSGQAGAGAQSLDELAGQSAVGGIGRFSVLTPLRQPILKWTEFLKADAYRAMDQLLTSPEGVRMLQKLAKEPAMSLPAQTAVGTFLATQANVNNPPEIPSGTPPEQ